MLATLEYSISRVGMRLHGRLEKRRTLQHTSTFVSSFNSSVRIVTMTGRNIFELIQMAVRPLIFTSTTF